MKYYFLHTQYLANGQTITAPIAEYESLDSAKARWHQEMAHNMIADDVIGSLTLIYEPNGYIALNDYYKKSFGSTAEAEKN